ncbi:betaine--homocysteine S-methyltransferase 1-like [Diadema setosum]|uniref:betaine--homocysteine S-methyltransferase 1-like n=1 Tax=Diadema setosum TaxID=31175 RepID=UPI003B3A9409
MINSSNFTQPLLKWKWLPHSECSDLRAGLSELCASLPPAVTREEQIEWAVDEGADFIVGETFDHCGEAALAAQVVKEYGKGVPAVITLASHLTKTSDGKPCTIDGVEFNETLRQLEAAGADVIGFNCTRGPGPLMTLVENALQAGIKGQVHLH